MRPYKYGFLEIILKNIQNKKFKIFIKSFESICTHEQIPKIWIKITFLIMRNAYLKNLKNNENEAGLDMSLATRQRNIFLLKTKVRYLLIWQRYLIETFRNYSLFIVEKILLKNFNKLLVNKNLDFLVISRKPY